MITIEREWSHYVKAIVQLTSLSRLNTPSLCQITISHIKVLDCTIELTLPLNNPPIFQGHQIKARQGVRRSGKTPAKHEVIAVIEEVQNLKRVLSIWTRGHFNLGIDEGFSARDGYFANL